MSTLSLQSPRDIPAQPSARQFDTAIEPQVDVSVVIPVFNEAANIDLLHKRLSETLQQIGRSYEIWYVDDGSSDGSLERLREIARTERGVGVIELTRNFGQHAAVLAGFAASSGEIVVTLDADLQNPPEEIPKLLAKIDEGYEVVGGWREERQDPFFRKAASRLINEMTSVAVGVKMNDYGCMLRAYKRGIVRQIVDCDERSSFIPALANSLAKRSAEIEVGHADRFSGSSKYGLMKLMRLSFDLITGFSLLPIQLMSLTGIVVAVAGVGFGVFLLIRRFFVGPEVEGVFTLFAILFVFVGIMILAVGLVGEYVGRIYLEVRRRPTYRIRTIHHQSR
ncbi:MAG TPA: glycosyltransferase [Candidatus Acidoferrales bacterium]|nr:glycosyltransferase [Candidatus Acidoferrales bacterium]